MKILVLSVIIAFVAALGSGYFIIPALKRLKAGQQIREDGPKDHLKKAGTPTMGGLIFTFGIIAACVIMMGYAGSYLWYALIGALCFGLIGLIDDLIIVVKHRSEGLKPYQKMLLLIIFSVIVSVYAYRDPAIGSSLYIPIADVYWDISWFYIPFNVFFILAITNCVNLTDGLDGLAGSVTLVDTLTFSVIFLSLSAATVWQNDMIIFAAACTGGILGFLRFNAYPAKVFMGDTGAFFLGGALAMMCMISRLQILIPVMGIMYVLSGLSCVIQVAVYKRTKKIVFKMAPLHHHFELSGVHETKIVAMYMLATSIACLLVLLIMTF